MASSQFLLCALGFVLIDMPLCARLDASNLNSELHKLIKEDTQMEKPEEKYVVTQETSRDPLVNASGMETAICCVKPKMLPVFGKVPSFQEVAKSLGKAFTEILFNVNRHSNPAEACKSVASRRSGRGKIMPTQCCTSSFPADTIDFLSLDEAGILPKNHIVWQKTPMEFWGCFCRILTKCLYGEGAKGLRLKDGPAALEPSRLVCEMIVLEQLVPGVLARRRRQKKASEEAPETPEERETPEEGVRRYYTEAYKHLIKENYPGTSPVDFCAA